MGIISQKMEIREEFFKFLKTGLGLEEFQILGFEGIRKLLGTVVIAASFIY